MLVASWKLYLKKVEKQFPVIIWQMTESHGGRSEKPPPWRSRTRLRAERAQETNWIKVLKPTDVCLSGRAYPLQGAKTDTKNQGRGN